MIVKEMDTNDNDEGLIEVDLSTKEAGGMTEVIIDASYERVDKSSYEINYYLGGAGLSIEEKLKSERVICSKSGLKQKVKETVDEIINNNHKEFLKSLDNYLLKNPCIYIDETIYKFTVYDRLIKSYKGSEKLEATVFIEEKDKSLEFRAFIGTATSSKLTKIAEYTVTKDMEDLINGLIIEKINKIKDWGFLKEE